MNRKENTTLTTNETVQEFTIRLSDLSRKKHHVMNFNANLNVNFNQWYNVKMSRENNMQDQQSVKEKMPKFGAGSEYNRELKEKMRLKKLGIIPKVYKEDDQPWILKIGGKPEKNFRGIRRGGVSEYTSYYVFIQNLDGSFDASPLHEWYDFQPVLRYKALSAEQAEKEFGRRTKILNYFSVMTQNRLHDTDERAAKAKDGKEFTICDDEDIFMETDDESDSEAEERPACNDRKRLPKKTKKTKTTIQCEKKMKKNDDSDEDKLEESDDEDKEGREIDYGEPSESEESNVDLKIDNETNSVADGDCLHRLQSSDEESTEEDLK